MKKQTKIQIILSIVIVVSLVLVNNVYIYGQENINTKTVGYLEENSNFIMPVEDEKDIDKIVENSENFETPNLTITKSETLLDFSTENDPINYWDNHKAEMVKGVELKIDDKVLYLENKDIVEETINRIFSILIKDPTDYDNFLETREFDPITINGKNISRFKIDNEISIKTAYVPKDKVITTSEELLFDVFHEGTLRDDFELKTYTVQQGDTLETVLEKNNIDEMTFFINNSKYKDTPLLTSGEKITVNKLSPLIDIRTYYKESVEEVEEFYTVRKDDDSIAYGDEELDQAGKNGLSKVTYEKEAVNGEEVSKKLLKKEVIEEPVTRIILEGTDEDEEGVANSSGGDTTPSGASNIGGMIWPSDSREVSRGLSAYHHGTDILSYYGSPEYAAADGTVATAGWSSGGGGYEVTIDHGGGLYTIYSHMAQPPNVSVGQSVYQGQVIGYMGQTGLASGTHLHFEVRVGCTGGAFSGTPVEPYAYMG